jgi:hypothetical protein
VRQFSGAESVDEFDQPAVGDVQLTVEIEDAVVFLNFVGIWLTPVP